MRVEVSQHEKGPQKLREQTFRVFSRLIMAAAACRPVFRSISEKRVPFLMRRTASPPGDPSRGRSKVATAPPQACIPTGPQQPTAIDSAVASVLQSYS
ncbi:hypothetical protein PoB_002192800 [Plakobranchus ocellatus]|uniref:Uncharacterized protein n=1 Tax=Plakobranchus ocellatus TaxID=259542 RepID=A0AAV3ZLU5_9GAST|nr:hypothetical protein PoB_002192800 [Plakobranchus ocellatus]